MTNEELFPKEQMLSAWKAYCAIVEPLLESRKKSGCSNPDYNGYAWRPVNDPFTWLYKYCDKALLPEYEPGKLVVDSEGHYGVILQRWTEDQDKMLTVNCVVVDFRGTCGKVAIRVDKLKPAAFPPELVAFAFADKNGLKEKVHEKVEEAFNA